MAVDDYFSDAGAVPFKWEIKPGVPKAEDQHPQQQQQKHQKLTPPPSPPSGQPPVQSCSHQSSSKLPLPKLKPPPAESYSYLFSPVESRSQSFRSKPRIRADRWRFDRPLVAGPEIVSTKCFFAPLLRRMPNKRFIRKPVLETDPDYTSDLETFARWSSSSRKSLSSLRESSPPSSVSSVQSSPRSLGDAQWAGFGLF